jgi:hypothetical protein
VAGARRERPFLPPAGHAAIDKTRLARQTGFRPQSEAFHDAGTKALDQHVGAGNDVERRLPAGKLLEIEADAAPATVENVAFRREQGRRRRARHIRPQNAQDFGPQIGKQHGAHRRRPQCREFHHLDPGQWSHDFSPSVFPTT